MRNEKNRPLADRRRNRDRRRDRAESGRLPGLSHGVFEAWSLVSAPFVIVTLWWIILPSFDTISFGGVPIHFDETDMAIYKTNHVFRIIIVTCSSGFMPRIWQQSCKLQIQNGLGRL